MRKNILGKSNNSALVNSSEDGIDRRGFLECMAWAGTGVLWTVAGGILSSQTLARAASAQMSGGDFSFVQLSDSHIGFSSEPNKDVTATITVK